MPVVVLVSFLYSDGRMAQGDAVPPLTTFATEEACWSAAVRGLQEATQAVGAEYFRPHGPLCEEVT